MGTKPTGSATSTTNTSPWAPQQPYLQQIFGSAQNLYNNYTPQYFPGGTYAQPLEPQFQGLTGTEFLANNPPVTNNAIDTTNTLLNGGYLTANPALGYYTDLANQPNPGQSNAGTATLESQAQGIANPAMDPLSFFSQNNAVYGDPAMAALGFYSSGATVGAGNPYDQALSQQVLASVLPSIQSQFIEGGTLSSPEAISASTQGATAALAPSLFQNYQTQEQLQQNAANSEINALLGAQGQQIQAATTLGNQALAGAGLQQGAASTLGQEALQGAQYQNQIGQGLQNAYGTGVQQMIEGLGLSPSIEQMPFNDMTQLYSAGATQQQLAQQGLNNQVAMWNYQQTLPYQLLNEYIGQVTGNYGGTTVGTQPILSNPFMGGMSALSMAPSAVSGAKSLGSLLPFFGG